MPKTIQNKSAKANVVIIFVVGHQRARSCRPSRRGGLLPLAALHTLLLALVEHLERLLSSLDTTESHSAKGRTHAVGAVNLGQLHAANNETRSDLAGALDNGVLGDVHVETAHATEGGNGFHGDHALDAEGAEGTVVAGGGDDDGCVDGVGVHAGLVVVVHGDESPVGDNTGDADAAVRVFAGDKVLDRGGVELGEDVST